MANESILHAVLVVARWAFEITALANFLYVILIQVGLVRKAPAGENAMGTKVAFLVFIVALAGHIGIDLVWDGTGARAASAFLFLVASVISLLTYLGYDFNGRKRGNP